MGCCLSFFRKDQDEMKPGRAMTRKEFLERREKLKTRHKKKRRHSYPVDANTRQGLSKNPGLER
jgi:hypothetical protein